MEPIAGISQLRPILTQLQEKGLIEYLTPQGPGCIVTHALYLPQEFDRLQKEVGTTGANAITPSAPAPQSPLSQGPLPLGPAPSDPNPVAHSRPRAVPVEPVGAAVSAMGAVDTLSRDQLESLGGEVASLRQQLTEFRQQMESSVDQLRRDLEDLNRQLGN
jgi:hypothetical protein